MKDLDFDELDRAVNSLITNAPMTTTDIPEKTLELEAGPTEPLLAALPTIPISKPAVTISSPLMARRSTGRFMDVVPPSVSTRVAVSAPDRISRQGVTIAPAPVATIPIAPVFTAPAPIETPAPVAQVSSWPDPIDFSGLNLDENTVKPVEAPVDDNEDADIDQINNEITNTINQTTEEPLDSPFISGTKVEKRPLGAFSGGLPVETPAVEPVLEPVVTEPTPAPVVFTEPVVEAPQVDPVAPASLSESFPAELSEDLLSIESGNATQPVETPVETPVVVESAPVAPTITVADNQPVVASSIAQQYTEQPSTGDQTSGAIYDTDAYHKALVTPAKKKSGWLWVLWIVILLAVGAGAGAAVYFVVLPQL